MRSGPGEARTILLFHTISARPPKQPRMVRTFLKVHTRPRLAYALRSQRLLNQVPINKIISLCQNTVHDVCVFVCKGVLGSSRASQPLNIITYAFSSTSAFSLRLMPLRFAVGATQLFQAPPLLHSRPSPPLNGLILLTYRLHLGLHYVHLT